MIHDYWATPEDTPQPVRAPGDSRNNCPRWALASVQQPPENAVTPGHYYPKVKANRDIPKGKPKPPDGYMSAAKAASRFGYADGTVRTMVFRGDIKLHDWHGTSYVIESEIEAYIAASPGTRSPRQKKVTA